MHKTLTSADGTSIAYETSGAGPSVLIIGGGPTDRHSEDPIAQLLSAHFATTQYDRRGRGDSGDTDPYSFDREMEDLAAVIEAIGGETMVYGTSGGAVVALHGASRGLPITRMALWEPSFIIPGTRPVPVDYAKRQLARLEAGQHSEIVESFMVDAVGMPAEMVAGMKQAPFWEGMAATARGVAHDAVMIGDWDIPEGLLAKVFVPTLVVDGGTTGWLSVSADEVAKGVAGATRQTLAGQPHNVDAAAIAPLVVEYLSSGAK